MTGEALYSGGVRVWRNGRRTGLKVTLSAHRETSGVELLKVGGTCHMAIPSQARRREGVETRRAAPTAKRYGEGIVQTTNRPAHAAHGPGGESRGGMKIRWALGPWGFNSPHPHQPEESKRPLFGKSGAKTFARLSRWPRNPRSDQASGMMKRNQKRVSLPP